MTSIIKVDNVQNTAAGKNIINESGNTVTIGASGDTVALASGASQTGFGQTYSAVAWDTTAKTTTVTGVAGVGYFINTTAGAITANLPAGTAGDVIAFADYAATWQTNNVTVVPNGSDKIGSINDNANLSTKGQSVTFVYVDSTQGWLNTLDSTSNVRGANFIVATGGTITTVDTNYKVHTFTGPGTFTVCTVGSSSGVPDSVSYMVVAGGGGGADIGGGGGAGGFREGYIPGSYVASPLATTPMTVTATGYPITIGAGGAGAGSSADTPGTNGTNSIFNTITATNGGYGGAYNTPTAGPGGSGGGGGGGNPTRAGGSGNTPPVSPAQGNNGGTGGFTPGSNRAGGGGGGATATGDAGVPTSTRAGDGGAGATTSINGTPTAYAGGGGGGINAPVGSPASGGSGGGGNGNKESPDIPAVAGTVNTGGGGGGGETNNATGAAAGGSGIVIIRYKFQ